MIRYRLLVAYGEHGRGVFALEDIPAGDVIEVAPVIDVPAEAAAALSDYVYGSLADGLSRLAFGYGSLYAHSYDPNVLVEHDATCLRFIAARDIVSGEELAHNYGVEWWEAREVKPRGPEAPDEPVRVEGEDRHPGGAGEDRSDVEDPGVVG
jgi:SET domain-containing protein